MNTIPSVVAAASRTAFRAHSPSGFLSKQHQKNTKDHTESTRKFVVQKKTSNKALSFLHSPSC